MKAAVIYSPGDVRVVDIDTPKPGPSQVLIQVAACGVCGTEHTLYIGGYYANYPVVLGHEFAGVVVEVEVLVEEVVVDVPQAVNRRTSASIIARAANSFFIFPPYFYFKIFLRLWGK